ncbi:MAG: hypothetical protein PHH77_02940 [Victivallaceae bacterium]|nr:hypothetical protein [Victivallaceae bacterium]
MAEEINVACPGCKAVFSVPPEFCGETAECAECGTLFEIPPPKAKSEGTLENTETGPVQGVQSDETAAPTNTVKLSRSGIGMIPEVKDDFKFVTSTAPSKAKSAAPKSAGKEVAKVKVAIPAWTQFKPQNGEEVIAVQESSVSPWKVPLLLIIPVIIAGIAGIVLTCFTGLVSAIIALVIITGAVFAVALLAGKKCGKKALIVTDRRTVCITGKEKMEISK